MWNLSSTSSNRSARPGPARASSPRSTLSEVLRNNPFRGKDGVTAAATTGAETVAAAVPPVIDSIVTSLNKDLRVFANFFPDVKIEVLRELLVRFDGDSRLQICTEQLIRYKTEWVRERTQNPPRELDEQIPRAELFRTRSYCHACKKLLMKEFPGLNKSAIEAVLAETNNSYSKSRPTLQGIAARSWRATFNSLFKKRKNTRAEAPAFLWQKGGPFDQQQTLVTSGSDELDEELEALFTRQTRESQAAAQQEADWGLAVKLNLQDAEEAKALFECQCCYNDVTFEETSACTSDAHVVCLDCVRRSLKEALFGQGWTSTVDTNLSTLKCLAPSNEGACPGNIPPYILRRAILQEKPGIETMAKFEERLANDALQKSQLAVIRCPFCSYAEAKEPYSTRSARSEIRWRFRTMTPQMTFRMILFLEFVFPTLLFIAVLLTFLRPFYLPTIFSTSLIQLAQLQQTTLFTCKSPRCSRRSCIRCAKPWHDPHTCHEPLLLSLRSAVEAARTAAVKRTCPRCGTSFVKASGCNKLTCICGYAMCYLCRKNIGKNGENGGAGEGYRHFCEHFRPVPGVKCVECDRCDLYKKEDEDGLVRAAGESAEREWRLREGVEGVRGVEGVGIDHASLTGGDVGVASGLWSRFVDGDWAVQDLADWAVAQVIAVDV